MIRALHAEWLKLITTRTWWGLGLALLGYVGFTGGLFAALFGAVITGKLPESSMSSGPSGEQMPLAAGMLPALVYSTVTAVGYVIPLILGTLAVTAEVRHRTLTPTFLAVPVRWRVLVSKLAAMLISGGALGVVGLVAAVGLGAPILAIFGIDPGLNQTDTWLMAARIILAMALWAAIGVGVGSLIPSQVAAVVVVIAFAQLVEPILRMVAVFVKPLSGFGGFLPGAASDALVGASIYTVISTPAGVEPLYWWQGGLVLAAYALVAAVIGWATTWRRDIT